jgi:hypothetical protein
MFLSALVCSLQNGDVNSIKQQTWLFSLKLEPNFGQQKCTNLSLLVLFSHSFLQDLGSSEEVQRCSAWQGRCQNCLRSRSWLQGIFCANFAHRCGVYAPCQSMWCGECYTSNQEILFHVKSKENFGEDESTDADKERLVRAWGTRHRPTTEFCIGRNGDHLLVPFECDVCIFRKLRRQSPNVRLEQDKLLLACIRRITLDAFWSRATSTVLGNRDRIRMGITLSEQVGLAGPYIHQGCMPERDEFGYEVAIQMVLASRHGGRHSSEYTQFDTIRKFRTAYSNQVRASPQANVNQITLGDDKGKVQRFVKDGCSSYWFSRFILGCKNRMGQDWRPNKALSTQLLKLVISVVERKIDDSSSRQEEENWIVFGTYVVITYVVSLRGSEGLLLDLKGLLEHTPKENNPTYFLIPLLGKVKGEAHDRCHLLPCACKTSSGIHPLIWINKLLTMKGRQGLIDGPAISDETGRVKSVSSLNGAFYEILEEIFEGNRDMFPASIKTKEDIYGSYGVYRSLRRS